MFLQDKVLILLIKIKEPETSRKIFVGRLSETLTSKDLQEYFSQFGQVIDVYIPKPFRAFGFVTFVEADIAQALCGESHIIKGCSVHVSRADPKDDESHFANNAGGNGPSHGHSSHPHHPAGQHNNHHTYNNRNESSSRRFSSNGHSSNNLNKLASKFNIDYSIRGKLKLYSCDYKFSNT